MMKCSFHNSSLLIFITCAINSKAVYFFIEGAAFRIKPDSSDQIIQYLLSTCASSKTHMEHFCREAVKELKENGIGVNNVGLGPIWYANCFWKFWRGHHSPCFYPEESEDAIANHKRASMNGELTRIDDIAPIVMRLATDGW